LHDQMPTAARFTEYFPQKLQKYLECWDTSIFLTCFRRDAPYRVPYLPTMPTFLVRLDMATGKEGCVEGKRGLREEGKMMGR